ncbi:MAG: hypothetical protein ACI9FJ_001903 [Alteromonadaceae bacterium]
MIAFADGQINNSEEVEYMLWNEVRKTYPEQWVVLEAISAHDVGNKRIFEDVAVVDAVDSSVTAQQKYRELHNQYPAREFLFVSTIKTQLDVTVHHWVGVRGRP